MGTWGNGKPDRKRAGGESGAGWLRPAQGCKVVRITSLPGCEVVTADMDANRIQPLHNARMLRFNAEKLSVNLKRQAWKLVLPQW